MQTKEQRIELIVAMFGEQATGLIGKQLRVLDNSQSATFYNVGDVGTVVLVDEDGEIWVDFGPDGFKGDGTAYPVWAAGSLGADDHEFLEN